MTKLCPRGKAAAKRKFKVYPSAYANAYASKICAGKIKDPSGVKRKDFKGPKPMSKGGGADTGTVGEIRSKQGVIFNKVRRMVRDDKDLSPERRKRILQQVKAKSEERMNRKNIKAGIEFSKKLQRGRRELFKSTAGKKIPALNEGGDVKKYSSRKDLPQGLRKDTTTSAYGDAGKGRPVPPFMKVRPGQNIKGNKGQEVSPLFQRKKNEKPVRRKKMMAGGFGIFSKKKKEEDKSIQEKNKDKKKKRLEELKKEIGAKKGKMMIMIAIGKPKKANKGAIMNVANKLEKASKAHAGQAKTLKSLKLSKGGGAAIRGTNFKGVF